ncbi:hypothetical protein BJP34_12305 [Moorena producens PAL-8-15-08-1]|uniref:CHAT domain-containing protein n=1 Tax=Moorena producens PAL-8-15-08-1 TaxID=1458985 RepID=A0A1D8TR79_9CYAN|nr:CHAT domain-containing protein [Moorena producens]AOX00125.1 hypothetical protein BJP34_12305 [Moorena producens PAL-8-15-08-1]
MLRNFLTNVARQLAKTLGLSSTSPTSSQLPTADSQLNFLMEVLQATAKSKGNPQVVYALLQANLEKLDDNLALVLGDWATVTLAEVEPEQAQGIAGMIGNFSTLIQEFPQGSRATNLEIAITGYEVVGTVFTCEAFSEQWATLQNNLGNTYCERIRGEKADNLEAAITAYQGALQVRTRQAFPQQWATTQNNLGNAYRERIRGEKADNLEAAITAYQGALEVYTRQAFPQQWAQIQNNLGNAYLYRIRGDKADNLEAAITAYQGALEVYTRQAFPQQWAQIQNNLGNAYLYRIRGDKADNLKSAIKAYQGALEVRTRQAFPQQWAMTQNNLATAYSERIDLLQKYFFDTVFVNYCYYFLSPVSYLLTSARSLIRGEKADNLEPAITAYQRALEVYTRQAFPQQWATIQHNLGNAYSDRIRGEKADNLEAAITAYQAALQVYTLEAFPEDWAMTQNSLGNAYRERIREEKAGNLEAAINSYQRALEVYTREAFPQQWAQIQNNLGNAYSNRIRGEKADNLEAAIKTFQGALEVYTREAFPQQWATIQHNLGNAYSDRIREEKADNLEAPIKAYQGALEVYTREAFPQQWAMTQNSLGNAYSNRISRQNPDNLEDAINAYQAALEVYTRKAFPQEWAMTQNNVGNAYLYRIRGKKADNLKAAIKAYQRALKVCTPEAFPQDHAETLFNLGLAYQEAQKFTNAYNVFADAIETVESLRGEIVFGSGIEADKQKLAEKYNQVYSRMVEVCLELDKPTEAIEYAERSKGRNLVDLLANKNLYPKRDRYPNPEVHQAHCQQLEQLRREIPVIQRELEIVTRNRESDQKYRETIKTQQQRLKDLKHEQDNLLKEINQLDLSFKFTQQVEPIPFSDIQALIDDHTAIIQWYITNNQIIAFTITNQNQQPQVRQSSFEDLKALFDLTNEYLATYYEKKDQWQTKLDNLLSRLAQILHIEEILAELPQKCEQLILIPHRFLHLFPLHALPIKNREQQANNSEQNTHTNNAYLLDLFPKGVRYAPSCQLLQLSQNQERPDFSKLFAIQNPTKDLDYADFKVNNILPLFWFWQIIYLLMWQLKPRAYSYLRYLFSKFPQVLAKQDATKAAVKTSQEMPLSHCIDFYCHGEFNLESPLESALILAKDQNTILWQIYLFMWAVESRSYSLMRYVFSKKYERLTLTEIFGLSLNQCRLVTLSACETGITAVAGSTYDYSSDEYISLPSGFLYAGSPSVVSSLWTVNEFATAFLMIKFYQNLSQFPTRETGEIAVALNQAQTWLREVTKEELEEWTNHLSLTPTQEDALFDWFEDEETKEQPFQSPYYWAAFCAIGK